MSTFKKILISLAIVGATMPLMVFAQNSQPTGNGTVPSSVTTVGVGIQNPFRCGASEDCTLMDLLTAILNNIIMPIAAVFVVLWIIYAGFQFVTAQGNPGAIQKAQKNLMWSLIGAGVLLGAAGISQVIQATVNSLLK
jgi:hypothetical protein